MQSRSYKKRSKTDHYNEDRSPVHRPGGSSNSSREHGGRHDRSRDLSLGSDRSDLYRDPLVCGSHNMARLCQEAGVVTVKCFDNCAERAKCLEEINNRRFDRGAPMVDRIECASKYCPGWSFDMEGVT